MIEINDVLTQALYEQYEAMHKVHQSVPAWMLEYAICPEHWIKLCQESVMRTHGMGGWSTGGVINILGFTLHFVHDGVIIPPVCLFHSLGV